ncbi:MAG TPA: proton-conducting transporter membrane subunit [Candidatus Eisenbacteria bacterium]|jgi:hydrogenase-4 component F
MVVALVAVPVLAGVIALRISSQRVALGLLLAVSVVHLAATGALWLAATGARGGALLGVDALGLTVLTTISVVFLAASLYAIPYLLHGTYQSGATPHRFVPCLLWFLAAMTLVCEARHLALMWAAIEATTLASAPLIYFYRRPGALEAAWKYLLLCSVGIALALLGVFFLGVAASAAPGRAAGLTLDALQAVAPSMSRPWLKAAFVLAVVGYGTKMGLAPLHTWLPDAHSQAPSPVSALLSGALLNCAFLAIARFVQICRASGDGAFARTLLLVLGFTSLAVATAFLVRQRDYKRLLAYSSVENMGIVAIGVGLGGSATYGAMLHTVNHSLCKAGLFFLSGNVLREFATTSASEVRGVLRRTPVTGALLLALLLALGGIPPFGPFWSKFIIFRAAMDPPHLWAGMLFIGLLGVAFLGMSGTLLPMLLGADFGGRRREAWLSLAAPVAMTAGAVTLGIFIPSALAAVLRNAAALLGN